jgi:hypothetical protein
MIIHAAANSSTGTTSDTYALALTASCEAQLLLLEQHLTSWQIPHFAFREPDRHNELMSIGIPPMERRMVRRFIAGFPLLGEKI